jgi:hypothetical protein
MSTIKEAAGEFLAKKRVASPGSHERLGTTAATESPVASVDL